MAFVDLEDRVKGLRGLADAFYRDFEWNDDIVAYVAKYGYVPEEVVSRLRGEADEMDFVDFTDFVAEQIAPHIEENFFDNYQWDQGEIGDVRRYWHE